MQLFEQKAKAQKHYEVGEFIEAMNGFESCLQLLPKQPTKARRSSDSGEQDNLLITNIYETILECHVNLALCLIRLAHFEDAVSCLTSVIHYAPYQAQAYYLRGKAFFCLNEYSIALGDLSKAKEIIKDPNCAQAIYIDELTQDINLLVKAHCT